VVSRRQKVRNEKVQNLQNLKLLKFPLKMVNLMETLFGGSCIGPATGTGTASFHLHSGFGYVVVTSVASMFMLMWKGIQVREEDHDNSFLKL